MKRRLLLLLLLAIPAAACLVVPRAPRPWVLRKIPARPGPPPDILLLTVDCLRADHVSCYGSGIGSTPALDGLARRGVRFARAIAPADYTHPSICSLMTGASLWHHGAINPEHGIVQDVRTVAEDLRDAGYATGALVNIAFGDLPVGLQRGFDFFGGPGDVLTGWTLGAYPHIRFQGSDQFLRGSPVSRLVAHLLLLVHPDQWRHVNDSDGTADADDLSVRGLQWMRENAGKPRFLWIHYFDAHAPYVRREPYYSRLHTHCSDPSFDGPDGADPNAIVRAGGKLGKAATDHLVDLYDSEVRAVDEAIGRVLDTVDLDRTFVAATADHGEELGEHGRYGHGQGLVRQTLLVPLLLAGPSVPRGEVVTCAVSGTDLASTLRDAAGIRPSATIDGRSLARCYGRTRDCSTGSIFSERQGDTGEDILESAILGSRHITFRYDVARSEARDVECFDWSVDPLEQHGNAPRSASEQTLLQAAVDRVTAMKLDLERLKLNGFRYTPEQVRHLKELGYLR